MYPDPALRRRAEAVGEVTDEVRAVAQRMVELMDRAEGIGLAAPQVALPWRLFVTRVGNDEPDDSGERPRPQPEVFIDPVLKSPQGAPEAMAEGCLSIPEVRGEVYRPPTITIEATDLRGERFTRTESGLVARCWQHEFDHLEGVLILDRFTQMSRLKNRSQLRTLERGMR